MKYIVKGQEPKIFTEWKNQANEDWTPTYDLLHGQEKAAVINSLKEEQGYVCCYCERELSIGDCHIEHLKPQGKTLFPESQLDYNNLLCSCQLDLEQGEPRHCGNSKGSWYDENLLISPLMANCHQRFKYTFDGYVEPVISSDAAASTTINKLQLSIDKLNAQRRSAIEPFIDVYEELTEIDRANFVLGYLVDKKENEGKYNKFYTTIQYLFS